MATTMGAGIPTHIRFTRKEKELLTALAEHPNCILSRKFLLKNVWGYSDEAQTRTVDVHIRRLRKKLEAHPDLQIHTIFGKGYVMENRRPEVQKGGFPGEEFLEPAPEMLVAL